MFEFYRIISNPGTGVQEVKKFYYEETPETLERKEKLERELARYEKNETTYMDRYYHIDSFENTYSLELSEAVFKGDNFVGCMENGSLMMCGEKYRLVSEEVRGATSVKVYQRIRRKY